MDWHSTIKNAKIILADTTNKEDLGELRTNAVPESKKGSQSFLSMDHEKEMEIHTYAYDRIETENLGNSWINSNSRLNQTEYFLNWEENEVATETGLNNTDNLVLGQGIIIEIEEKTTETVSGASLEKDIEPTVVTSILEGDEMFDQGQYNVDLKVNKYISENLSHQIEQNLERHVGDANIEEELSQQGNEKMALDLDQHSPNNSGNEIFSTSEYESGKDEYETVTNLTKKGENRKRRKFKYNIAERKAIKLNKMKKMHPVKTGCGEKCRKKCNIYISEERRLDINNQFWGLSRSQQINFMMSYTSKSNVKRKTVGPESRRTCTLTRR
ncbi:hypothetical protein RI129_004730 [Pyrocoelia pectoralis]|uniref:Uncharacterized protein n=1 Tax=Pyrocoelia pectoralis TaxID=417401 RepID=A0AAN7ZR95_9COLE